MSDLSTTNSSETVATENWNAILLADYRTACISREASLLGRKEVLTGKAKFGIFGDGKEVAQLALSKIFKKGDFRSGYYRDQTFMMALELLDVKKFFAALYAHTDIAKEPTSGGRQMGGHFATRNLDENGHWKNLMEQYNSSADISPTAGQMPRLLGLAQASKVYRALPDLADRTNFTNKGNEIAIGTIGDASTSEGLFWETMNAAAVLKVPMLMSVWDDGYGISVPKKYQTVRESISAALSGFQKGDDDKSGIVIKKVKGWDYPALMATYAEAEQICRTEHIPVLVHVEEVTQPQGHSTSGSHERYKSKERLAWAEEYDCIVKLEEFILQDGTTTAEQLAEIRKAAKKEVRAAQKEAWAEFTAQLNQDVIEVLPLIQALAAVSANGPFIQKLADGLSKSQDPIRKETYSAARKALRYARGEQSEAKTALTNWLNEQSPKNEDRYSSYLHSQSDMAVEYLAHVPAVYGDSPEMVDGRLILRDNFQAIFERYPEVLTFGEDTGKIGGVNQSMEGMQEIFGETRVSDTGIREATILGQGIGMAMRGLRPIAEIQYLDYLYYALQIMRDDLASVQYRTKGGQKAPLIVRTRGHRLEGIWHSGSPMGAIINSVRGMIVATPRNMTQAAGMYNTLLQSDEPALVVECLNGYRSKEPKPQNLGSFTVPIGHAEVVREGEDITILSYGSTLHLCVEAATQLLELGINVEIVDAQTLLPFDIGQLTTQSLSKTNRLLIVDEDVPGGAAGYLLDQVLNTQNGFFHLDSQPRTLSAKPHLPAYGTDGDYFSKPSIEDIVETVYAMFHELDPSTYPAIY